MIAVFDSGLGGLSVWRELKKIMPDQDYVYVADSANCPYGQKPQAEIIARADLISEFLIGIGADVIVVACNTATAAAIAHLRNKYNVPFVGIEPAVKPAAMMSRTGVVGVLATANTLKAELYHRTLERFASNVKVISQVGEGLVDFVEKCELSGAMLEEKLKRYIDPMLQAGADTIVLGCTHFPFLREAIAGMYGERLALIDPAPAVAAQTRRVMGGCAPVAAPATTFYTNGDIGLMHRFVERLDIPGTYNYKKLTV